MNSGNRYHPPAFRQTLNGRPAHTLQDMTRDSLDWADDAVRRAITEACASTNARNERIARMADRAVWVILAVAVFGFAFGWF